MRMVSITQAPLHINRSMLKVYDVLDSNKDVVATMPSYEDAYEYIQTLELDNHSIVTRDLPTVRTGFGRDPDLH